MTNQQAQAQIETALAANSATEILSKKGGKWLSTRTEEQILAIGENVTDAKALSALGKAQKLAQDFSVSCVAFGLLLYAKSVYLDARGKKNPEEEGFTEWCARTFGDRIKIRQIRTYMFCAKNFLKDLDVATKRLRIENSRPSELANELAEAQIKQDDIEILTLPDRWDDQHAISAALDKWVSQRTLSAIVRDIKNAENDAVLYDNATGEQPEEDEEDEVAEAPVEAKPRERSADDVARLLLQLDKILKNAEQRDNEVKDALAKTITAMTPEQTRGYFEGLQLHYEGLASYYAGLIEKQKNLHN